MERKYTVITENDESQWKDKTGELYHFPKRYLTHLQPGTHVIYYKGKMRDKKYADKRLSKEAHYFGFGYVWKVFPDRNSQKGDYFAVIHEYKEFTKPVLIKVDGEYLEPIPESKKNNYWRDGVRAITYDTYQRIMNHAGIEFDSETNEPYIRDIESLKNGENILKTYSIEEILPSLSEETLLKKKEKGSQSQGSTTANSNKRYSKNAKKIGDIGEKIVEKYLKNILSPHEIATLEYLPEKNLTPGYDFCYIDSAGKKICIEVKSTQSSKFGSFNITINEWTAAKSEGDNYFIYLVADCLSKNPKIEVIQNPFAKYKEGAFNVSPILFEIEKL